MAKGKYAKIKKRRFWPFLVGMAVYAIVFLAALYFGLGKFWDFIAAYEKSRPLNTIQEYVEQLNEEDVFNGSADLISQIDHNIQTEEECRQIIADAVSQGITYAKKTSECTDTRLVYVLRSDGQVIGSVTMDTTGVDEYGFAQWQVTDSGYDMSHLMGLKQSITVPSNYPVYANGVQLDSSYITVSDIRFEKMEVFYDKFELPTMVTYEAGPILGDTALTVTDPDGNPVEINENTDYDVFLDNCTPEEVKSLEAFGEDFLDHYVAFTGSAFKSSERSYEALMDYVVQGSDLATRMEMALEGLEWAQSRGDELVNVTFNHLINVGNDRYLCDVTYQVDTTGREGVVRTTNNARFVVVDTGDGLLVETLLTY